MNVLYFDAQPLDIEMLKSRYVNTVPISGGAMYMSEVFKALLRYSTYDVIALPKNYHPPLGDLRSSRLFLENSARIRQVENHDMRLFQEAHRLVLFSPLSTTLSNLIRIRRTAGCRHAPIVGVIHSQNNLQQLAITLLPAFLAPLRSFDAFICSSIAGRDAFRNIADSMCYRLRRLGIDLAGPSNLPIIPLGLDVGRFESAPEDRVRRELDSHSGPVILSFGRLSPTSKGDPYPLLVTFAELHQTFSTASLILAGDDTHFGLADDLRAFSRELGCGNHVRVVPNPTFEQKLSLYKGADIFVSLPDNLQETFGITIIEAMASGLPVIAASWNGYKDLVEHDVTGYLIPTIMPAFPSSFDGIRGTGDMLHFDLLAATTIIDLGVLKDALAATLRDAGLRKRLGDAGRRRALARYDWSGIIPMYESLWEDLSEMALSTPKEEDLLDLTSWAYMEVFRHYPDMFLGASDRVAIGRPRDQDVNLPILNSKVLGASWFDRNELLGILELVASRDSIRVSDLLAEGPDPVRTLGHLARLLKYGLLKRE